MDLPVFLFHLLLLLGELPIIAGNECSDGDCLFGSLDVTGFHHLLQERFHDCAKLLLEWQAGPDFYGMPWHFLVIVVVIIIIFFTFVWRMVCTVKSTISRLKEDGNQNLESLQAEHSKGQELEEKIKMLEQDRAILQSEKIHLEKQAKSMQKSLDSKDLCQDSSSTVQQTSDSEHRDSDLEVKVKSLRQQIQDVEQERRRTEGLLRTEIAFHEKQAQENLINTHKAEYTLAAERKEIANLRQKMIEVNAQLEEIKRPVFVPSLRKDDSASGKSEGKLNMEKLQAEERCKQLEEKIKKMEGEQSSMCSEKNHQETLNMILRERLEIMHNLCQQKDNTLQQKLAQEKVEQCVKEIKADGPKNDIRNLKKEIQEINEKNDKTQSALKAQIAVQKKKAEENWIVACSSLRTLGLERREIAILSAKVAEVNGKLAGYQRLLFKGSTNIVEHPLREYGGIVSSACKSMEKWQKNAAAGEERNQYPKRLQAEEKKTKNLDENVHDLKGDSKALKKETFNLQIEINSCNEKIRNMNELCQRKDQALQRKAAQIDSERRDKELKVKEVLKSHKQKVKSIEEQQQKTELSYKAEIESLKKKLQEYKMKASGRSLTTKKKMANLIEQQEVSTSSHGSSDESLANAVEEEQNLDVEKLQAEERKAQELEREQFQTTVQSELHNMTELCQQKEQALQQNAAQVKEVLMSHQQKIQTMEDQHRAIDLYYKAEINSIKKKAIENLMKACSYENLLTAHKNEITNLCKQLDKVRSELAEIKTTLSVPNSAETQTLSSSPSDEGLKLANAVEEEQNLYVEKLQAEERKTQEMEEKIQTLEQERDALKKDKSQLEHQTTTVQSELHIMTELWQQKEQALQHKAAQTDAERRCKELKVKEVLRSHQQKYKTIEVHHKTMELYYKAEINTFKKKSQEHLMKACSSEHLLTARKKEITNLHQQLDKVRSELAEIKTSLSVPNPAETQTLSSSPSDEGLKLASAVEERHNLYLMKLQAEERKTQEMEEKIQTLEQERDALKNDKSQLEHQTTTVQSELHNMTELCQQKEQALQHKAAQTDSECRDKELKVREVLKSHKQKIKTIEEQHQKAELSLKAEIDHLQKSLENLARQTQACSSERALAARQKEMSNFRKQIDQRSLSMSTPSCSHWEITPAEKDVATQTSSVSTRAVLKLANALEQERNLYVRKLQAEKRKTQELEEQVQTLEQERDDLKNDKSQLEHQTTTVQSELHNMTELCQQKEQALQQKAAQTDSECRDKEMKVREVLKSHKQKIKTIEEQHQKAELSLKAEIDHLQKSLENLARQTQACSSEPALAARQKEMSNFRKQIDQRSLSMSTPSCSHREITPAEKDVATQTSSVSTRAVLKFANAVEEERNLYVEKLQAEERKTQELEEQVQTLEQERGDLKNDKSQLEHQTTTVQSELHNMTELCQQKEQALQQKAAQTDSECRDKEMKVREVLKSHKQKIKTIEEQHQKAELSLKAEIDHLQKSLENLARQTQACSSERALAARQKEMSNFRKQIDQRSLSMSTPSCSHWEITPAEKDVATQTSSVSTRAVLKLANALEQERNLYVRKLQAEERKTQELEEQVQTLEQERDDLKNDKSQLEHQTTTVQSELHNMTELCQQKEQALQQKAAQTDSECRDKELKVKEVLKSHKQKIKTIEEQHQKAELSLKAELKFANAVEEERNLYVEKLQAEERKTQELEEQVQTLEQERDDLKNDKSQLEHQTTTVQSELHIMTELCQQKEQALQQKAVQAEWVQTERDAEVQCAFQAHSLRVLALEEEYEKRQCSYKAQIEFQEQQAQENLVKAWSSEQALAEERKMTVNLQNMMDGLNAQLAQFLEPVSEPTPSCFFQQLPPYSSDCEDIPLLDLTAGSASSSSTTGSQSWSLLEVEGNQPAQRPRRSSLTSMSLSTMKDKGTSFLTFFKRS